MATPSPAPEGRAHPDAASGRFSVRAAYGRSTISLPRGHDACRSVAAVNSVDQSFSADGAYSGDGVDGVIAANKVDSVYSGDGESSPSWAKQQKSPPCSLSRTGHDLSVGAGGYYHHA